MRCNACGAPLLSEAEVGRGLCASAPCAPPPPPRRPVDVVIGGHVLRAVPVTRSIPGEPDVEAWRADRRGQRFTRATPEEAAAAAMEAR